LIKFLQYFFIQQHPKLKCYGDLCSTAPGSLLNLDLNNRFAVYFAVNMWY